MNLLQAAQRLFLFGLLALATQMAVAQDRVIQLEIAASDRAQPLTQQRWMEALANVGADRVRSRTSFRSSVSPGVEEMKLGSTISIVVTGVIQGRQLLLPGGRFELSNTQGIRDYLQKLRDDGTKVALAEKKAFGLTSEQLVGINDEFSAVVNISTRGVSTAQVVQAMAGQLKTRVVYDSYAQKALRSESSVVDELKGLSVGTSLAAAVRPLGLVVQLYREQGKSVEIRIVDARTAEENWPIGWPIDKPVSITEPALYKKLSNIEIRGFPLKSILDRFEQRVGVPFLYDQNSMAREGIDLEKNNVTLVKKKVAYYAAISKLLSQVKPRKMKQEVRVDENGKPFVWFSTQK